ncbi:hypothetical protein [Thiolapillus brandeum]|uniref:Uncharacterized protein n=1 Tax=Thiolapillus brandeum TaxID=1076588 RepID=A0A7U6JH16_9GAMM|nr:hypothetical protein [Thiolapillus brandeum]BAO43313.1 hypothetical protein TBH_C0367 [Thiolapillus brandeum]
MSKYFFVFLAMGMLIGANARADDAERTLHGIMTDIQKYETRFSGQTQPNKASVRRTLKLLGIRRQSLDSLADHNSPQWKEADQRCNALVNRLNAYLGATASTTAPARQTTRTAPAQKPAPSTAQMMSHDRVRLKKLKRDLDSLASTLDKGGIKPFQDPDYVSRYTQAADRYEQTLNRYSAFQEDPDVQAATQSLNTVRQMLAFGRQQSAREMAGMGDVQATLKKLDAQMHALKLPEPPGIPLKKGQARAWLLALAKVQKQAQTAAKPLSEIRQKAHLPNNRFTVEQGAPYDQQDVARIQRGFASISAKANEALRTFSQYLQANLDQAPRTLDSINAYDPANPDKRTSWFLGKGRAQEVVAQLQAVETLATEAADFSALLGNKQQQAQRQALATRARQAQSNYLKKRDIALSRTRMPAPASDNSGLLEIARKTLSKPKYGVGRIERLVIVSNKEHRSRETSEEKFHDVDVSLDGTVTLTGTKTTYHYEWDQYQVATAEPDGDKYYIYYNTLKYFTSGASTTPLNHWILGKRFQGSEILEGNIDN